VRVVIDHFDRVRTCLKGGRPDRVPISFWGHMYYKYGQVTFREASREPEKLAHAHLAFCRKFDIDFLKMMPDGMYMAERWGTKLNWDQETANALPQEFGVKKADDWERLSVLNPSTDPVLLDQLKAVELLADGLDGSMPFIQTLFTPITWAIKTAGQDRVIDDMRKEGGSLKHGLEMMTESVVAFGQQCLDRGVTGFFLAMQNGSTDLMTPSEFDEFSLEYDLRILRALSKAEFLLLHVCTRRKGDRFDVDRIAKYPVHAISWWDRGSPLTLSKVRELLGTKFCLVGGLDHKETLLNGFPQQIEEEAREAIESVGKNGGFMLGPGCTVSHKTPDRNLNAAIFAASKYSQL